jgi:hypothetical protein
MYLEQRIEIPLSKSKIVKMLIGALVFVAIGFWFVIAPPTIENSFWGSPAKLTITGYASIIIFGLSAITLVRKLTDTKSGLIIDREGIIDHSGGMSAGQILWNDIINISVIEIHKQKMIMLEVKNPQEYIGRQSSLLKRKSMELNYKMYGTPISITANGLDIPFKELLDLLSKRFYATRTTTLFGSIPV